jgi:large subunit ribosomal protein L25
MEKISLSAKSRDINGKNTHQVRQAGLIPAVVYGHGIANQNLTVEGRVFDKILNQAGESTLVDLTVDSQEPVKVLIQEVQRDAMTGAVIHVDFRQVKMTEKLEADIEINLVGEAPAVKALGGILITNLAAISVSCLPGDLVPEIEVDISGLKEIGDSIKIGDLTPPPGIEFLHTPDEVVVVVNEQAEEEPESTVAAEGAAGEAAPPLVGEEKKAE